MVIFRLATHSLCQDGISSEIGRQLQLKRTLKMIINHQKIWLHYPFPDFSLLQYLTFIKCYGAMSTFSWTFHFQNRQSLLNVTKHAPCSFFLKLKDKVFFYKYMYTYMKIVKRHHFELLNMPGNLSTKRRRWYIIWL